MRVLSKATFGTSFEMTSKCVFMTQSGFTYDRNGASKTDWFNDDSSLYVLPSRSNMILDMHIKASDDSEEYDRYNVDFFDVHVASDSVTFHRAGAVHSDTIPFTSVLSLYLYEEVE